MLGFCLSYLFLFVLTFLFLSESVREKEDEDGWVGRWKRSWRNWGRRKNMINIC